MRVLVVGGAGYIGSHMVKQLHIKGIAAVTLDNLFSGFREAVLYGDFVEGDLANPAVIDKIFEEFKIDAVMHFASYLQVGESVVKPSEYYRNNVVNTQNLLDSMVRNGVNNFVFSSTAAIFGEPDYVPIDENHPERPINPYGKTKLVVEGMLEDYDRAYGLKSVSLRYFNAAGADPDARIGERHDPETHLIPLVLQAASGRREHITVFGDDYDTPDGTCIRDYIHVDDLCDAHSLALEYLRDGGATTAFNLGNGHGYSIKQVLDACKEITGRPIAINYGERRQGDPASLIADFKKISSQLDWRPRYAGLGVIVEHAWKWEQKFPWGGGP